MTRTAMTLLGLTLAFAPLARTAQATTTQVSSSDVTFWVQDAEANDPYLDTASIQVATADGIVTLSGTVGTLAQKKLAVREAEKIRGVTGVVDQLTVEPSGRSDDAIVKDVRARLRDDPTIVSPGIQVECTAGEVTLTGEVGSWSEKDEATLDTSRVRGVRSLTDRLWVRTESGRTDTQIQADAQAAIQRDVYLADLPITVTVKDGVARLAGDVGSSYEKARAERTVRWIWGVKKVDDQLKVDWRESWGTRSHLTRPTDGELESHVTAELAHDPRVDATHVVIDTEDGHVTLAGQVPDLVERRLAGADARDVLGVVWVTNDLNVEAQRRDDWAIHDDVRAVLDEDPLLANDHLNVKVVDGFVFVSGTVGSPEARQVAESDAAGVRGVRRVVNELHVTPPVAVADADLASSIGNRLHWNEVTAPVGDDIHVAVDGGVVTLSGNVQTWAERQEAARVALRTTGVTAVSNQLEINGIAAPWDSWQTRTTLLDTR